MDYLVFNTYNLAEIALNEINFNMNIISPNSYSNIMERLDNKFVFKKPNDVYMNNVENYTIEEYNSNWFKQDDEE